MSAPQKPHVVPIEIEGIPQVLKSIAQWTCWSYSWIADDEKWTKVPVQASDPQRKASSTNPETWGTLEQAVASYEAGLVDGIGFVLTSDDPFTVIDVDHCIDETGRVDPDALATITSFSTFTEASPSGTGAHIWIDARKSTSKAKKAPYEIYESKRYMTVTGQVFVGVPNTIEPRQAELDAFCERLFGGSEEPKDSNRAGGGSSSLTDDEIIEKARNASNGSKFSRLWSGDTSEYGGDESRADAALAGILVFYTPHDDQVSRIMRRSGLNRAKFDRADYLERTIKLARTGQSESFSGSGPTINRQRKSTDDQNQEHDSVDDWSFPPPLDDARLPEFPAGALPPLADQFAIALANATETPLALTAPVVLGSIATAAGNKYRLEVSPGYFEQTNLWLACFMSSGNRKSAVFSESIAPLLEWERERARQDRINLSHWQAKRDMAEIELKDLKNQAVKGKDGKGSSETRLKAMGLQEQLDTEKKPVVTKLIADDVTVEKAVSLLDDQGGVLAVMSAEGYSIFGNAAGRYQNGATNLDNILKAQAGDTIVVDRAGREGEHILRPYLNLTISPQPSVARSLGEIAGFIDRGGAARILPSFPVSKVGYRLLNTVPVSSAIRDEWVRLISTMLDATPPQGGDADGHKIPCTLKLSSEARAVWEAFWHEVEVMLRPGGLLHGLEGWGGKAPGSAARIAALHHIATATQLGEKPEQFDVEATSMSAAVEIMRFYIPHAQAFYDHLKGFGDQSAERELWMSLESMESPTTKRALFRKVRNSRFRRAADIDTPLSRLEELDYVRVSKQHHSEKGGRPSDRIEINPLARGQNRQNSREADFDDFEGADNSGQNRQNPELEGQAA